MKTTTLRNEISDYEDFSNAQDGQDCYIAPIFGNVEIKDYNEDFAKAAAKREFSYNVNQSLDGIKHLVGGAAIALIGTTLFKMAISAYASAQSII